VVVVAAAAEEGVVEVLGVLDLPGLMVEVGVDGVVRLNRSFARQSVAL
jgi:hypothetical protein